MVEATTEAEAIAEAEGVEDVLAEAQHLQRAAAEDAVAGAEGEVEAGAAAAVGTAVDVCFFFFFSLFPVCLRVTRCRQCSGNCGGYQILWFLWPFGCENLWCIA